MTSTAELRDRIVAHIHALSEAELLELATSLELIAGEGTAPSREPSLESQPPHGPPIAEATWMAHIDSGHREIQAGSYVTLEQLRGALFEKYR